VSLRLTPTLLGNVLRKITRPFVERILRGVDHCQNINSVRLDAVNDAKRAFNDLSDLSQFVLRYGAA
jgi:hypothetical protein